MEMNIAHIHIVLNHIPSLGTVAGLLMLIVAMRKKNDMLKEFSFGVLALMAMATLLTYLTGNPARRLLTDRPAVSLGMVELHQNAAMLTLAAMLISGTFAWFGLWETRRFNRAGKVTSVGTLLTTLLSAALILYTAGVGGKISHPEIRSAIDSAVTEEASWRPAVEAFMAFAWAWPAAETLHFVGMGLLFGVTLLVMLRMLGAFRSISFPAIHRLLPLAILGFVINVLTGMLFYIAIPSNYYPKQGFMFKIVCIFLAAVPTLYFTMFDAPWRIGADGSASITARIAAVGAFAFLLGVMIFGRLLPFFN